MALTATPYLRAPMWLSNGTVDWDNAGVAIKFMLVVAAYTPDTDAHDYRDDLGANEASGTNYPAGGWAITTRTVTVDAASNETRLDGDDVAQATLTSTWRYGVVYVARGGAASADELLGLVDFGQTENVGPANVTYIWNASGVLRFTTV
jgi:hypothetical protein